MPDQQVAQSETPDYAKRINDYGERHNLMDCDIAFFQALADEALRNERERCAKMVKDKRDGTTARFAYGGYSRELWHLNTETLKTVCNELLKEIGQ